MLENLRRKSLVKTYIDPIHQVCFEQGLARYRNHAEIDVCNQKLSKELQENLFQKAIDTISKGSVIYLKLPMIFCPSGTFEMGHNDMIGYNNPPRQETINRPFLLGETEITQELYEKVMNNNPSEFKNSPQNPVENVLWEDAILFCNELSRLQGLDLCYTKKLNGQPMWYWDCDFGKNGYRLPEKKEWEYAAKAGTQNQWAGTNDKNKLGEYAWFGKKWSEGSTHPVKTKKPNEWGFYDMSGNVSEWCWDKNDPNGSASANRVICGGSWNCNDILLRSVFHRSIPPSERDTDLGFRVARSMTD